MSRQKSILLVWTLAFLAPFGLFAQPSLELAGHLPYPFRLSNIWGYTAPDGTEYALVGTEEGVSLVDVSEPSLPVEVYEIPGPTSNWREVKTWGHFAYATNENALGMLVMDLSQLPDTVIYTYHQPTLTVNGATDVLNTAHSLFIDDEGYLYLNGAQPSLNSGGVLIFDLNIDPWQPPMIGAGEPVYVHDCYARGDRLYTADIYAGEFSVYDISDRTQPQLLATQPTPSLFAHNTWLSDDGNTLFTTDERPNAFTAAYDVSDWQNIRELDRFRRPETEGKNVIPHNVHVLDDYLVLSNYTDGVTIIDAARPDNLLQVANYDTYDGPDGGFAGCWGVYPYFPSGTIVASDINRGLFVLRPTYLRAAYLQGTVRDSISGSPLNGVRLGLVGTATYATTDPFGAFRTGSALAGSYTVLLSKPGYRPELRPVFLQNGQTTTLAAALMPAQSIEVGGIVSDSASGAPLPDARVLIANDRDSISLTTDAQGRYRTFLREGVYTVSAGKWGWQNISRYDLALTAQTTSLPDLTLGRSYEDFALLDLGWESGGDAVTGRWERAVPIGLPLFGAAAQTNPPDDSPNDPDRLCFLTQNGGDFDHPGSVQGGTAWLRSPLFDLRGQGDPVLLFDYRFNSIFRPQTTAPVDDTLRLFLSNGLDSVEIWRTSRTVFSAFAWWPNDTVRLDALPPTCRMRLTFSISNDDPDDIVEVALDNLRILDAGPRQPVVPSENLQLSFAPNPFEGETTVSVEDPAGLLCADPNAYWDLEVFDAAGRLVERHRLSGLLPVKALGRAWPNGIYRVSVSTPEGRLIGSLVKCR